MAVQAMKQETFTDIEYRCSKAERAFRVIFREKPP